MAFRNSTPLFMVTPVVEAETAVVAISLRASESMHKWFGVDVTYELTID